MNFISHIMTFLIMVSYVDSSIQKQQTTTEEVRKLWLQV
jgi:hypothetical protein